MNHYLIAVTAHGELCACGHRAPRLIEHFGQLVLREFEEMAA